MTEYNKYIDKIIATEDRVLIQEAIDVVGCGQYRAAYILVWIACVESIIRRFKEISLNDNEAAKCYGKIIKIEEGRQATDKQVIQYALNYGFIDAIEHVKLLQIYTNRCIFVHPYNAKPTVEEFNVAFINIIDIILSKEALLRHGYITREIKRLLTFSYLGHYDLAIQVYMENFIKKIDPKLYVYFIEKYWQELDKIVYDPSKVSEFVRGVNISCIFLASIDIANVMSDADWHNLVSKFDIIPCYICTNINIFPKFGQLTQDTVLLKTKEKLSVVPFFIQNIVLLKQNSKLSEQQEKVFSDFTENLTFQRIVDANLPLFCVFEIIIDRLKSHNWYTQSPTIDFIRSKSIEEISNLTSIQQEILGRNILQTADGTEKIATNYLEEIARTPDNYPYDYIKGIVFEIFINELGEVRLKSKKLDEIVQLINNMDPDKRVKLITELEELITKGTMDESRFRRGFFSRSILSKNEVFKNILEAITEKEQSIGDLF